MSAAPFPPADLTSGRGDHTCPVCAIPAEDGCTLLCWRNAGHTGHHYDRTSSLWWIQAEPAPAREEKQ